MSDPLSARDQRVFKAPLGLRVGIMALPPVVLAISLVWVLRREDLQAFAWSDARAPVSYLVLLLSLWFCARLWAVALRPPVFIVTSEALYIEQGKQTRELRWSELKGFAVRSGGRLVLSVHNGPDLTFRLLSQQLLPVLAALTSCLQQKPELRFDGARSPGAWVDLLGLILLAFLARGHAALDHPYGMLTWGVGAAVVFFLSRGSLSQHELGWLADSPAMYFMTFIISPGFVMQSNGSSPMLSAASGVLMAIVMGVGPLGFGFVRPSGSAKSDEPTHRS